MTTTTRAPRVSVAFVSCNRLHYLRAAIESARRCIRYSNLEWLVVDNASSEPGMREYLDGLDGFAVKVITEQRHPRTEHMAALNTIVQRATGEYLLILSDDVQFVIEGDWMSASVELLQQTPWITSVSFSALRATTIARSFGWRAWLNYRAWLSDLKRRGLRIRTRRAVSAKGVTFRSFGFQRPAIDGVGMQSLTATRVWKQVGPWQANAAGGDALDSSGGGEVDMLARAASLGVRGHMVMPVLAPLATIVTDGTGTNAKVRGDIRYGDYRAPLDGPFYYRIRSAAELGPAGRVPEPIAFEDYIEPIGFALPIGPDGVMRKIAINTSLQQPLL